MHLKRQESPKRWPIVRKGTKYMIGQKSSRSLGMPVVIVLRDVLSLAQNRKEVKEAISSKKILVNGKPIMDEKRSILLFDVLAIPSAGKFYRLSLSKNGKFMLEDIREGESMKKVSKVTNKKMIRGGKIQINLMDGKNFLSNMKCKVNDSVLIDLKKGVIEKCLPLQEKSRVFVFEGKHSGKEGVVKKIDNEKRMVEMDDGEEKISVLIKQVMVTE